MLDVFSVHFMKLLKKFDFGNAHEDSGVGERGECGFVPERTNQKAGSHVVSRRRASSI